MASLLVSESQADPSSPQAGRLASQASGQVSCRLEGGAGRASDQPSSGTKTRRGEGGTSRGNSFVGRTQNNVCAGPRSWRNGSPSVPGACGLWAQGDGPAVPSTGALLGRRRLAGIPSAACTNHPPAHHQDQPVAAPACILFTSRSPLQL